MQALAESGPQGAHALIRERSHEDAELERRLNAFRERIRRQAERNLARSSEGYDQRLEELSIAERRSKEEIDRELAELEEKLRASRARGRAAFALPELAPEVTAALLIPTASWNQPPRLSLWQRLRAWFVRVFGRLFGRRRAGPVPEPDTGRRVPLVSLSMNGRVLGPSALGEALARLSPEQETELSQRVGEQIRASESDLRKHAEQKRHDAEIQRRRLEEEKQAALQRNSAEVERKVREAEDRRIDRELRERGMVVPTAHGLEVTYALVERFARLLLAEEEHLASAEVRFALRGGAATGIYEKAHLRQPDEIARLDVPSSLLAARLVGQKHLDESTSYIYREATSETVQVVLALDRSGSMAEDGKLEAAKKALLALYVAVRRKYPTAVIDVLAFDNVVQVLDLVELWSCSPGAFTNTAEALRTANHLFASARSVSRREFFLITDGLPEAYTDPDGTVRAGQLESAMNQALARARELAKVRPLRFSMVLLKSSHPEYETAAWAIARAIGGELVVTDPSRLGIELLVRWTRDTEVVHRPTSPMVSATTPSSPRGAGRRRRADRRMGG